MRTEEEVIAHFTYRKPTKAEVARMSDINEAIKFAAIRLFHNCPENAERTIALRALEEARMRANQSIILAPPEGE